MLLRIEQFSCWAAGRAFDDAEYYWAKWRYFSCYLKIERTINGHDGRAALLVRQVVPVTWLEQQLRDRGSVLQERLQIVVNFKAWVGAAFACHFWRFEWRFRVLRTFHLADGPVDHFWIESGLIGPRVWNFWFLWFGQFAVSKHDNWMTETKNV